MTPSIHEIANRLAEPASRAAEAVRISAEVGAEAFLIFLHDEAIDGLTPAPGFPPTLPGGPSWRAFLRDRHSLGLLETELPFPKRDEPKIARVLVRPEAVFMLIGGAPRIQVGAFAEVPVLSALLRAEAEQLASAGLATAAGEATSRATKLAAALDTARAEVRRKADELAQALVRSDRLNTQLERLNETLEQRIAQRTSERNMLATLLETTDVMVMACDLEYNILAVNKANADEFERIYGVHPHAGDNMLALLSEQPEHQAQVRAGWARALAGEERTFVEDFGDPARVRPYYEISFRALRNDAGERIGAYQFVTDVSHRIRAQAQLLEAQEALRQSQKMDAMGQLTGGVAHDFNNLLMPIIGSLDMLQRKGAGDSRSQRMIDGALQSAERAKTLVQRLLAFARRQPLQPHAVDVGALVHGMEDLLASTVGPRIQTRLDVPSGLPAAVADANQVEMALLNLAVNARDAMPDGGTLTIALAAENLEHDHGIELRSGAYLRLCVHDTGVGMDEDTRARATEPFFSTKGIGRGTGLGLSMVHGLAAQLGGALTIESESGEGTTIKIWLPLAEANLGNAAKATDPEAGPGSGTVLLVDDEALVRASTADMLSDLGYRVIDVESAEEALRRLDEQVSVDILVTDHLMPRMTGTELAETLHQSRADLPVLVISGYAEAEGIGPGFARLTKPFRQAELGAAVAKLLVGKRP